MIDLEALAESLRVWEPEDLRLQVGDRVRFRPRTECRSCWDDRDWGDGTPEEWDGQLGVVMRVRPWLSHPYSVRPDAAPFNKDDWDCARAELEVLAHD